MGSRLEFILQSSLFSVITCALLLLLPSGVVAKHGGFDVGVVLDLPSAVGKTTLTCINMALSDFYAAYPNSTTRLRLHPRDSTGDVVHAASAAVDLMMNEKVQAIVGPQTSVEAMFLADLGTRSRVPVISFSATSPSVSPKEKSYFVRAAPNDADQAEPIAAVVGAFGWKRVVVVYEDTNIGSGPMPSLFDALKDVKARVPYRLVVSPTASKEGILKDLYKLKTMQTRVFVVHMGSSLASRFFPLAMEAEMMSAGYAWIITEGLAELLDSVDAAVVHSMQGVIAVKPYIAESKVLGDFKRRWRKKFLLENPDSLLSEPSTIGLRAYDTIWALAKVAETLGVVSARYAVTDIADTSSDMALLGTSEAGPEILDSLLNTTFDGLSGNFRLINGELRTSAYEVVNLIGTSQREVGFWTPPRGLSRHLDWSDQRERSTSRENLGLIIWPGESTVVPKGWVEPVGEEKIRVGIPKESGFDLIMKTDYQLSTNMTIASGFVIEVFEEAVKKLPYAIPLEYVAYEGSYDSLVKQIALQKFDAVVGDITITYDRSLSVDFTLPYTGRGVAMAVPAKDQRGENGWIFLKPMVLELWLAAGAFFVFTGAIVWVLEHRVNNGFRGPRASQIGSVFYFSFSTLVFAHKEKVVSNLSRVVVIVWLFVVLVLTSSYTASLASMFTVRRLQPKYSDINDLRRNGESVGYPKGSFVEKVLKDLGFHETQMKGYLTPEEYKMALAKGSKNGGVSAIVDEIPYLRVFIKDQCSSYTITDLIHNTEGFGYAFPKGSPLAIDLSRSILNMTGSNKILEIENRWFREYSSCAEKESDISLNILDFKSFWGLFFITGLASTTSFLVFIVSFLRKNWEPLSREVSGMSLRQKIFAIFEHFDREDLPPTASPRSCSVSKAERTEPYRSGSESPFCMSNNSYIQGNLSPDLVSSSCVGTPYHSQRS
ncbi:unnamed protein product [Spirodela intermedia]|uniref:Glutamate receptor n=1 Tax=Spirodela intermedia TaxID=51605 RepID=A0A7I8LDR3_SPIIN|nr:unnamed protein product [Spirodela intermedia]